MALALDKNPQKGKFESRSQVCIMLGYSSESKAYKLWSIEKQKVIVSRDVKFLDYFPKTGEGNAETSPDLLSEDTVCHEVEGRTMKATPSREAGEPEKRPVEPPAPDNTLSTVQEMKKGPGRPKKIKTGLPGRPKRVPNMVPVTEAATVAQVQDPENVKEALEGPNADDWKPLSVKNTLRTCPTELGKSWTVRITAN